MSVGRLLELTVADLALIDRLRLTLDAGLNVITGETGAGKSLLIDARVSAGSIAQSGSRSRILAIESEAVSPAKAVRPVSIS